MTEAHDPPRSRRILRLIALERMLRGVLLAVGGTYLLTHLGSDYGRLAERIMRTVELDPHKHFLHGIVSRLHRLRAGQLRIVGALAIGYGGIEIVEGIGLWLDQLWAEYLTITVTTLLIPFEIYELVHQPSLWKAGGITVNIIIVLYLFHLLRRRLARESGRSAEPGVVAPGDRLGP
jgi:uncharacterized membrane protein (DUF2068 family)